jgi:hypothetical protein
VLGVALGEGRRSVAGQRVDGPVSVDAFLIGFVPGALRQGKNAGYDAGRHFRLRHRFPDLVEDPNRVAVADAPYLGIQRVDPQAVDRSFPEPRIIAVGGMSPLLVMVADELEGK